MIDHHDTVSSVDDGIRGGRPERPRQFLFSRCGAVAIVGAIATGTRIFR
ncbi:hypothetical protein [Microbacterium sp. Marseille-Q6648]|nr:hypothetical protein [Microbacterium sp. Marseille-Q6648]